MNFKDKFSGFVFSNKYIYILTDPGYFWGKSKIRLTSFEGKFAKELFKYFYKKGVNECFLKTEPKEDGICSYNYLVHYAYALLKEFPSLSERIIYNHLLTDDYMITEPYQKKVAEIDVDFPIENHEDIMKDLKEKMKYLKMDFKNFTYEVDRVRFILDNTTYLPEEIIKIICSFL